MLLIIQFCEYFICYDKGRIEHSLYLVRPGDGAIVVGYNILISSIDTLIDDVTYLVFILTEQTISCRVIGRTVMV